MLRRGRTRLMPQTFRCRMHLQCMISPLRDARLVEDAVSGASVLNQPQANASVLPVICVEHDSPMARHDSSNAETAKPTIITNMHTVLMADLDMIMNCIQKLPMIRKQLSPANGTPSPEQQRIQKFYSLLLRIRIKPQQLLHLRDHGLPVVRTCYMGQHQRLAWHNVRPTSHEVQICVAASPTCHTSSYYSQQPNLFSLRNSLESTGAEQLAPLGTTCSQCV